MIKYISETRVLIDTKLIGKILPIDGGYQYLPKGQREGGAVFTSLERCKESLEEK